MQFNKFRFQEGEPGSDGSGGAAGGADDSAVSYTVPESYSFAEVDGQAADETLVAEVSAYAKEHKFSQEQAQALLNREVSARAAAAAANKAPDAYEFAKIKVKDETGAEVEKEVDATLATEVSEFAKANNLSQAQAQAYMDRELKLASEVEAENAAAIVKVQETWRAQAQADEEIGGPKFEENVAVSKRALQKFFPDIEKEANKHPFLDHPQVLKGLVKIGQLIGTDGEFIGGKGSDTPVDAAKVLFPNQN